MCRVAGSGCVYCKDVVPVSMLSNALACATGSLATWGYINDSGLAVCGAGGLAILWVHVVFAMHFAP